MKKLPNIDWIFFDIGGVLLDSSSYEEWRIRTILEILKQYRPEISKQDIISVLPKASGIVGHLDNNIISCFLFNNAQAETAKEEMSQRRKREVGYYQQSIRAEALLVVKVLAESYKLGILANQPTKTKEKLTIAGLTPYFNHIGVSADYHFIKPDPALWQEIFKETGATPERSAVVDDNIERCLLPAKKFGMITIWYKLRERNDTPKGIVDYTITGLGGLLDIL